MIAIVHTYDISGMNAVPVTVEVETTKGVGIHLVGILQNDVREILLRTVTALQSIGCSIPGKKIIINVAPSDLCKGGSGYDLPIALGLLSAAGQIDATALGSVLVGGELGLDGSLRSTRGGFCAALLAKESGIRSVILPVEDAAECVGLEGVDVYAARHLREVLEILEFGNTARERLIGSIGEREYNALPVENSPVDLADIPGNDGAKRALEIAAAGGHPLILVGVPGSRKLDFARALVGILPPLSMEESVEATKVASVAGRHPVGMVRARPFRFPHYSSSLAAMLGGGGSKVLPGEVTLANKGVLCLDEFTLFPNSFKEALRIPLDDKKVRIVRLRTLTDFPADFFPVLITEPCPCGYYGEGDRCSCSPGLRKQFLSRLNGPILDRVDIHAVTESPHRASLNPGLPESSAVVAGRVAAAREIQRRRFEDMPYGTNHEIPVKDLDRFCRIDVQNRDMIERLISSLGLSARAYSRILKVARTIADLAGADDILAPHLAEACSWRFLDRMAQAE